MQILIPQYLILVLNLSLIYTVPLIKVFSIPRNQFYPGIPVYNFIILVTQIGIGESQNYHVVGFHEQHKT